MIKSFVGHSFDQEDSETIDAFKKMFDSFKKSIAFDWEDAEGRQIKPLSEKVRQKMEGKNLFIGIFTKKHIEVEKDRLLIPRLLNKDKYIARKMDCAYGTSYWIVQESGYAIAKGMKTLFIIGKGVRDLKGLHADMEHIYFERKKESECFSQLNEALGIFLKELGGEGAEAKTETPPEEPKKQIDKVVDENVRVEEGAKVKIEKTREPKALEEKKDDIYYFREIYIALSEEEKSKVKNLKNEVFEKYKDDEDKTVEWQAKILSLESIIMRKDIFNDLIELQNKKPKSSLIAYYVASEYEKYNSYGKATEEYLKSAEYAPDFASRLHKLSLASNAYAKNNQQDEALRILLSELSKDLSDQDRYLVYMYLSDLAKLLKNDNLFTAFSEKALTLNPSSNTLRFSLAYKYADMDKDGLALYHYKILAINSPDSANLNNLGVAYASLGMPSKAVESYIKAGEIGSTISRANLAQKLLNEGFIDYAQEQLNKAMESKDYEKDNVGRALSRIDSIYEEETKKEDEALRNIEQERQFKLEYAEAYSIEFIAQDKLSGEWVSRHGKAQINVESGNLLRGKKEEIVTDFNWYESIGSLLATGAQRRSSQSKKIIIFEGRIIRNRIIEYKIKIEKQPLDDSLARPKTTTEFTGTGIISKALNEIKVIEYDKDKKESFYELRKT